MKTLYISNDPAQRGWIGKDIDPKRLYAPPVPQGAVMVARSIAEVIESKSTKYSKGDQVLAATGWAEYCIKNEQECQACENIPNLSATHYLGAFGLTGLTAYYGLTTVARVGKDDTVVLSGAAGATGSMAVQIAKKMLGGKKVIGMA